MIDFFIDILACLSSVIIAATGEELAEITKINDEEGSFGEDSNTVETVSITTTTTTTKAPVTANGTEAPMVTKSPEEVKLESKEKVQYLSNLFVCC